MNPYESPTHCEAGQSIGWADFLLILLTIFACALAGPLAVVYASRGGAHPLIFNMLVVAWMVVVTCIALSLMIGTLWQ